MSSRPTIFMAKAVIAAIVSINTNSTQGTLTPSARANDYRGIRIQKPMLVSCWDDRFMMTAQNASDDLRVMYRDPRTNQVTQTKAVAHNEDDAARPTPSAPTKFGGARSTLGVPMLKDGKLVDQVVGAVPRPALEAKFKEHA